MRETMTKRIVAAPLLLVLGTVEVMAFAPSPHRTTATTAMPALHATTPQQQGAGAAASLMAGWMVASQVALANPFPADHHTSTSSFQQPATTVVTAIGFGNVDTLDFSMPSYEDPSTSKKGSAPSFNPFADFEPTVVTPSGTTGGEEKAAEEAAAKAEAKAEAEAKKAEAKAEAEARKAAQKAEAEARRAAEREARQAEKEAAAAEKAAAAAAASSSAPAAEEVAPSFQLPDVPEIKLPSFSTPDVKVPEINVPDFKAPDIKIPEFNAPDIKIPNFKFSMPKMDLPDMPKMDLPSSAPNGGGDVAMPKVDLPDVKLPDLPKVSLPALPNPFASSSSDSTAQKSLSLAEPQALRDERAREAREAFLEADEQAVAAETAAKAVRQAANEKKKLAGQAKDIACETRPGGKILCLRNPFNAGF